MASKRKLKRSAEKYPGAHVAALPFLWKLKTGVQAVGLGVVPRGHVWVANDQGAVFQLTHDGAILRALQLPSAVQCFLVDDVWQYAACNDGNVYDVGARAAPIFHLARNMTIGWLARHEGTLCVADAEGGLWVFDVERNLVWEKRDDEAKEGWMVRADATGLHHGSRIGLRAFDWSGALRWHVKETHDVRFGAVLDDDILVTGGWATHKRTTLHVVTRAGRLRLSLPLKVGPGGTAHNGAESCAAARDAAGAVRFYASCGGYLFCFDSAGLPLWRAPTGCGSACNMEVVHERLYVVTTDGTAACIDVSAEAIARALTGIVPIARAIEAPAAT